MDKLESVIAVVVSLLTGVTTLYNVVIKDSRKRELEYYEKVLKPFADEFVKDQDIDALEFLQPQLTREEDYIPRYIFYLMHKNKSKKLKRVLLNDFVDLYKNDRNNLFFIIEYIGKMFFYAFSFVVMYFIGAGLTIIWLKLITLVINILLTIKEADISILIQSISSDARDAFIGGVCILIGVFFMKINYIVHVDRYSLMKTEIKRIVKRKNKEYKKCKLKKKLFL